LEIAAYPLLLFLKQFGIIVSPCYSLTDDSTQFFLRLHTESLLVSLPTPDFSMPYNVICLACTVVAIAFGSLHNLTTRSFNVIDPEKAKKGPLQKLKNLLTRKKAEKKEDKNEEKEDQDPDKPDKKGDGDTGDDNPEGTEPLAKSSVRKRVRKDDGNSGDKS